MVVYNISGRNDIPNVLFHIEKWPRRLTMMMMMMMMMMRRRWKRRKTPYQ